VDSVAAPGAVAVDLAVSVADRLVAAAQAAATDFPQANRVLVFDADEQAGSNLRKVVRWKLN
jgi:hypothetical protein